MRLFSVFWKEAFQVQGTDLDLESGLYRETAQEIFILEDISSTCIQLLLFYFFTYTYHIHIDSEIEMIVITKMTNTERMSWNWDMN